MKEAKVGAGAQAGFTLVELIMVIVILGILAVAVMGKYQDLTREAANATVKGIAGEIAAASKVNFAARSVNASKGVAVDNCNDASSLLSGGLPSGYTVSSAACSGGTATCNVTEPRYGYKASFTMYCIN